MPHQRPTGDYPDVGVGPMAAKGGEHLANLLTMSRLGYALARNAHAPVGRLAPSPAFPFRL